jgi:diguanylate cyclase (GGDEF)-like protein
MEGWAPGNGAGLKCWRRPRERIGFRAVGAGSITRSVRAAALGRVVFGAAELEDERERRARLASVLYVAASVVVLATLTLLPSGVPVAGVGVCAAVALAVGIVVPWLPWRRWPEWLHLALPTAAFVLLAIAGLTSPGALGDYLLIYVLAFLYLGLTTRPGVPSCFVPLGLASFAIGNLHDLGVHAVALASAAPVWILVGEIVALGIAERRAQEVRRTLALARAAETDPLTALANRRSFDRALERLRPGDAIVLLDLDRLKWVNDSQGHPTGDQVLRDLAAVMTTIVRAGDTLARFGGDEFAMVLPGAGVSGAELALQRLRELWRNHGGITSFSAGAAIHAGECPDETLVRADAALYEAKTTGGDQAQLARHLALRGEPSVRRA